MKNHEKKNKHMPLDDRIGGKSILPKSTSRIRHGTCRIQNRHTVKQGELL